MANTRHFHELVRLDSGLLIPSGAAAGKILRSDGSGNASWISSARIVEHAWGTLGEVKNETFPGISIKIGANEEKKLIAVEYKILTGTSVEVKIEKNGAEIAGYGTIKVEKAMTATASSKALSDKDFINIVTTAATGTPTILSFTAFFESMYT